jgi:hypothetical protein
MTNDVDWCAPLIGESPGDGRDVVVLVLDGIRRCVAAGASSPAIDRSHAPAVAQQVPGWCPGFELGHPAVDQEQRRTLARSQQADRDTACAGNCMTLSFHRTSD